MIKNISVEQLVPHPGNPRKELGDLAELTESIKIAGVLQNLTVVKDEKKDNYRIIIGHRRHAAAKQAGLTKVPCAIVKMDEKEQISTMLLENMQRSDLTVYEQAQGFQLMMDLGASVSDIVKQTGFSDSTVRRRVKLLELDQDKLKEASERGGTLMDFVELEKIKDKERKDRVLEAIGTNEFNFTLRQALREEEMEENKKRIIEELSKFAIDISADEKPDNCVLYEFYYYSDNDSICVPQDAGEVKYFFKVHPSTAYLYRGSPEDRNEDPEKREDEEKKAAEAARISKLEEISNIAYKLRRDFICDIPDTQAKKKVAHIVEYLLTTLTDHLMSIHSKSLAEFSADERPEKRLLIATYLLNDSKMLSYINWRGQYQPNVRLDEVYEFLGNLGYKMSSEEKALQDGTHELFTNN